MSSFILLYKNPDNSCNGTQPGGMAACHARRANAEPPQTEASMSSRCVLLVGFLGFWDSFKVLDLGFFRIIRSAVLVVDPRCLQCPWVLGFRVRFRIAVPGVTVKGLAEGDTLAPVSRAYDAGSDHGYLGHVVVPTVALHRVCSAVSPCGLQMGQHRHDLWQKPLPGLYQRPC